MKAMALGVAFRAFFAALFNRQQAERLRLALLDAPAEKKQPALDAPTHKPSPKPASPTRSDALGLLSTLQREARLLDLVHESLDGFDDAQIGAAAREVLRDCRQSLARMFAIEPLSPKLEGETIPLDGKASPARLRLVGKSQGSSGTIAHRGWQATRCELPSWNGQASDALILAPVEVDVQ
jgi:hypothetical protein